MYHSVTFIGTDSSRNTWDDWMLVPTSRPVISPPSVKTQTIDIPGANGSVDLTESLTGYPVYKNRTGSIEFMVLDQLTLWSEIYSEIMSYLHGRKLKMVLEDDPDYYYEGRFNVSSWKTQKTWSRITINYDLFPYKMPFDYDTFLTVPLKYRLTSINLDPSFYGYLDLVPKFTLSTSAGSRKNLINLGKYLNSTHDGMTITETSRSVFHISGTAQSTWCYFTPQFEVNLPAGAYTFQISEALPYRVYFALWNPDGTLSTSTLSISAGSTSVTATCSNGIGAMRFRGAAMTAGTAYDNTIMISVSAADNAGLEPYISDMEDSMDFINSDLRISKNVLLPIGETIDSSLIFGGSSVSMLVDVPSIRSERSNMSGSVITFDDGAEDLALTDLTVDIWPATSGSGDPTPTNPVTLSTRNTVNIYQTDGTENGVSNTYTISLGRSVWGATLDATTGALTVTKNIAYLASLSWSAFGSSFPGLFYTDSLASTIGATDGTKISAACSIYKVVINDYNDGALGSYEEQPDLTLRIRSDNGRVYVRNSSCSTVSEFTATLPDSQLVHPIATTASYTIDPTDVLMLHGTNTIWSDTGDISIQRTLEYRPTTLITEEHISTREMTFYPRIAYDADDNIILDGEGITVVGGDAANDYIGYYCEVDGRICVFAGCEIDRTNLPELGTVDPDAILGHYSYSNWHVNTATWTTSLIPSANGITTTFRSIFYAFNHVPEFVNGFWDLSDALLLDSSTYLSGSEGGDTGGGLNGYNWVIPIVSTSNALYTFQKEASDTLNTDGVIMLIDYFKNTASSRTSGDYDSATVTTYSRHYAIGTLYYQANTYSWKFYTEISDPVDIEGQLDISIKKGIL